MKKKIRNPKPIYFLDLDDLEDLENFMKKIHKLSAAKYIDGNFSDKAFKLVEKLWTLPRGSKIIEKAISDLTKFNLALYNKQGSNDFLMEKLSDNLFESWNTMLNLFKEIRNLEGERPVLKNPRKFTKKVTKTNPVNLNKNNLRRWIYLNIPKYTDNKGKVDQDRFIGAFMNYFDLFNSKYTAGQVERILSRLRPYKEHWEFLNLQKNKDKITKIQLTDNWRKNMIEEPELIEMLYT